MYEWRRTWVGGWVGGWVGELYTYLSSAKPDPHIVSPFEIRVAEVFLLFAVLGATRRIPYKETLLLVDIGVGLFQQVPAAGAGFVEDVVVGGEETVERGKGKGCDDCGWVGGLVWVGGWEFIDWWVGGWVGGTNLQRRVGGGRGWCPCWSRCHVDWRRGRCGSPGRGGRGGWVGRRGETRSSLVGGQQKPCQNGCG